MNVNTSAADIYFAFAFTILGICFLGIVGIMVHWYWQRVMGRPTTQDYSIDDNLGEYIEEGEWNGDD